MDISKRIKSFWDDRAREYGHRWQATLGEEYLRLLEIREMSKQLRKYRPRRVLDVGCGNGYSTKIYASRFPRSNFIGIDYSEAMIRASGQSSPVNCSFAVGDVLDSASFPPGEFDVVLTQRCIQNIPDYDRQRIAIGNLLDKVSSGGVLFLMECSRDGVEKLNGFRNRIGLPIIEGIEPWHNCFLRDQFLIDDFNAKVEHFSSTYMFLSKAIHPRLAPVGYHLPAIGKFGYDKLYIIRPY